MKLTFSRQVAVLASIILTHLTFYNSVSATTFDQQEVDQSSFIAIARPYGNNQYDLLILHQIAQQRQCWSENGSKPITVEPLLLNFDFTGSCERSTDSNGYSVRIDGTDYGLNYLLRIVERNGELLLVATNRIDRSQPEIIIGRTYGMSEGFLKFFLNPGWRFTKRSYQGQILGHVYLTGDTQAMIPEESSLVISSNSSNIETLPSSSSDSTPQSSEEYTFTAESSQPPLGAKTEADSFSDSTEIESFPSNNDDAASAQSSPVTRNNSNNFESSAKSNSGELPPPPFSPTSLPPIAPPSQNPDSQMVPPPSLNSSNSQRQNLSDALNNLNGNSTPSVAQGRAYKVLAEAKTGSQQQQLRSLYPEAFPTKYNGQSFLASGVFSTSDNAETVIQTLKNAGLNGRMIPF